MRAFMSLFVSLSPSLSLPPWQGMAETEHRRNMAIIQAEKDAQHHAEVKANRKKKRERRGSSEDDDAW